MPNLIDVIKNIAPTRGSADWQALHSECARVLQRPIQRDEFRTALEELARSQQVTINNDRITRSEPDFPEFQLEDAIESFLSGEWSKQNLRVDSDRTVFFRTARGGTRDTGLFSRPDFSLATIRRLKYDPLAHLDVITFELKNNSGATLMAVHEALAHTRFAHYSFLICPRSRIRLEHNEQLRNACAQHGIGLVMFDIEGCKLPEAIKDFAIEVQATRCNPDPYNVEEFLEARLPSNHLAKLAEIANDK
jgi:hypothetical protein